VSEDPEQKECFNKRNLLRIIDIERFAYYRRYKDKPPDNLKYNIFVVINTVSISMGNKRSVGPVTYAPISKYTVYCWVSVYIYIWLVHSVLFVAPAVARLLGDPPPLF
jgi:hypothetical protein